MLLQGSFEQIFGRYIYSFKYYRNIICLLQYIAREDRVAFVGISNWALDPAKMNRGVMITRGSPDEKQLKESAW